MCRGVPKLIGYNNVEEAREQRKSEFEEAHRRVTEAYETWIRAERSGHAERAVGQLSQRITELEAAQEQYQNGREKSTPNPYVVVALDERDQESTAMMHTAACRATCNPLFNHKFASFPLGEYSVGRRAMAKYQYRDMNYTPKRLVFLVFHDDGMPVDGVPGSIREERWERASANQRQTLLARAVWDLRELIQILNCPNEVTRALPLFNVRSGNKIQDAELTIRARATSGRFGCRAWFRRFRRCNALESCRDSRLSRCAD